MGKFADGYRLLLDGERIADAGDMTIDRRKGTRMMRKGFNQMLACSVDDDEDRGALEALKNEGGD